MSIVTSVKENENVICSITLILYMNNFI
jgi:hypothetical protein